MTNILAVDASTEICSVALRQKGEVSERVSETPRAHADRLLPMVDELLINAGLELKQLDAIGFGAGPGSFTGLRICLGVVQGLAFAANLPVVGVSTLAALALTAVHGAGSSAVTTKIDVSSEPVTVAPVLDARMGEVYLAVYRVRGESIECVLEPQVVAISDADSLMCDYLSGRALSGRAVYGVGSGWNLLTRSRSLLRQCDPQLLPTAAAVSVLASQSFQRGQFCNAATAEPIYLRTEISWKKRERIRGDATD